MSFAAALIRNISNLPGWRTNKKIVVIESDDWGSIRMPSTKAFDVLQKKGMDLISGDSLRYNMNDNLATADDLTALFEVLSKVKDKNNRSCVVTAISIVANPDFDKIRNSDFSEYFYEPFTETLKRFKGCENSFSLWQQGISDNVFVPEFHGREHLNIDTWMKALQRNDYATRLAFDFGFWGFVNKAGNNQIEYQAAFDIKELEELKNQKKILADGLKLFETLFGFKATYFVPPNGWLNNQLLPFTAANGIRFIYSPKIQIEPLGKSKYRKVFHYPGKRNHVGQYYLMRNCFFEPNMDSRDWVNTCLNDISIAFRWRKPAVISSHRVNYIGALNPSNRDKSLMQLTKLLSEIVKIWPDVEFLTATELGNIMVCDKEGTRN